MASQKKLGTFLEWHNGSIRVVVSVPKALQAEVGKTKLKAALGTDSPTRAEALKWPVITRLKAELGGVARLTGNPLVSEALQWKRQIADAERLEDREGQGPRDLVSVLLHDRAEEIERSHGLSEARSFVGVAVGSDTPLTANLETFLAEKTYSPRYKDDIRRAVGRLSSWCSKEGQGGTLEEITVRVAGEFVSKGLAAILGDRKTINKDVSALSSYWRWLVRRGHLGPERTNPWLGQGFEVPRSAGVSKDGAERAFTEAEAAVLLYGPASPRMSDIMWIAALSGMRIDEVCRLQVRDCIDGWFSVNARRAQTGEGKTDAAERLVPVHSRLAEVVERLSRGKPPAVLLIDGLPAEDPKGLRKPSAAAGQEFTRYRRALGVDEVVEGRRRARVNFHSWRRWFVTEALRANQPLYVVSAVVGHQDGRQGVTLSAYNRDGPSGDQVRAVVESVHPPLGLV